MSAPRNPSRRSARATFCSTVLTTEIFVVIFAVLVAFGLRDREAGVAPIWIAGGVMVALCVLAAGMVRRPSGLWVGSVVQVVLIASGFAINSMFFVGAIFAILWVIAIRLGGRIDAERLEREAAEDRLGA